MNGFQQPPVAADTSRRRGSASWPSAVSQPRLRAIHPVAAFGKTQGGGTGRELPGTAVSQPQLRASQRGVALVVTLIMLSVITFLAIAFLVLSRREKGAVTTATDQTVSRLAAESAIERAKMDLLAPILAFTNAFNYQLRVSTNYINAFGFNNSQPSEQIDRARLFWATNTSYAYNNGAPVVPGSADFAQVVGNLFYDPRPPVFVTNRLVGVMEFPYYLDLNRNARYDTNGLLPVMNPVGGFYDNDGVEILNPIIGNTLSNFFVGDPEWIGMTERPEYPHSATNRFTSRFAWIAIPAGQTLDINYIHNQANNPGKVNMDAFGRDFLRNQGVGSWEINLAAFLYDLNTNYWGGLYTYDVLNSVPLRGVAFADAGDLYRFRLNGPGSLRNYNRTILPAISDLFSPQGVLAFTSDQFDGYSAGPLMTNTTQPMLDSDLGRVSQAWPGSETPERFFTTQDFFDPAKADLSKTNSPPVFFERLQQASTSTSSYDRYTFYRLLSQLGTDSEPDPPDKMNLNYDNLARRNPVTGVASATNFYAWRPVDFFTNAADRMLRAQFNFGVSKIPVFTNGYYVYPASVQRILQLAANLCDAAVTNRVNSADPRLPLPSVFRPVFLKEGGNVFITRFMEEPSNSTNYLAWARDLRRPAHLALLQPDDNVYGVPWILGAKKGLPNFNEFAFQSVFQITRKLQVTRRTLNSTSYTTNQMYIVGISNVMAAEVWNSYRSNYTRPVEIIVANDLSLTLTNSDGLRLTTNFVAGGYTVTNVWPGTGLASQPNAASFIIPFRLDVNFPAASVYRQHPPGLSTNLTLPFERTVGFPVPQWGVAVTNRLRVILRDNGTKELLDYVHLAGLDNIRDLSAEIALQSDGTPGLGSVWNTNRVNDSRDFRVPTYGIINQIEVSMGNIDPGNVDWKDYGFLPSGRSKEWAIDNFRAFFGYAPLFRNRITNTNLAQEVPFTPSLKLSRYESWQANDPLIHYTATDLMDLVRTNDLRKENLSPGVPVQVLENIGRLNLRYRPWGGSSAQSVDPNKFNLAVKDPGMRSPDDWDFPTNKFPNLGWLGRVHRGTPWQTVYLKSSGVDSAVWKRWSGNGDDVDSARMQPVNDRLLFDLFTTALTDSAARGRLSINQPGLAAWSAVFGGVLAVTNGMTDKEVEALQFTMPRLPPRYDPVVIEPAGVFFIGDTNTWSPLYQLVHGTNGINQTRANTNLFPLGTFTRLGDILAVPALTEQSPFLNRATARQKQDGLTDAAYERLPQQVLSLLKGGGQPRFVVYGFGQTLRPADRSVISGGPFAGLCTNYQITAESAIRAVVRVEGAPDNPRVVIEDYNLLPPD